MKPARDSARRVAKVWSMRLVDMCGDFGGNRRRGASIRFTLTLRKLGIAYRVTRFREVVNPPQRPHISASRNGRLHSASTYRSPEMRFLHRGRTFGRPNTALSTEEWGHGTCGTIDYKELTKNTALRCKNRATAHGTNPWNMAENHPSERGFHSPVCARGAATRF